MRRLRPHLSVRLADALAERHPLADEDVHLPEAILVAAITDLTDRGARVLDPFAGFGSTLRVAQALGREAVGVELLAQRCAIAARAAPGAVVHEGDARRLREILDGQPPFDLVLTSPPYMTAHEHPEDPLAGYTGTDAEYGRYLEELGGVFTACLDLLAPGGHVVVDVADIDTGTHRTLLAGDVARLLGGVGILTQDVVVEWDELWHDLTADHLLVARPR